MKGGARVAAVTTGPIGKGGKRKSGGGTLLVCVVGNVNGVEGVLSTMVKIDGDDATKKITTMISRSRFSDQIRIIALNGIALAGLNVIDIEELEKELGMKSVVLTRKKPHASLLKRSIRALKTSRKETKEKMDLVMRQRTARMIGGFYVQTSINEADLKDIVKTCVGLLRLSHIVSRGISTGESKGRI